MTSSSDRGHEMRERPALGFISMQFVCSNAELLGMHRNLDACAADRGLRLRKVYAQSPGGQDAAFDLLRSLMESDGLPLVVPTLHHLAVLGNPLQIRDHLSHRDHEVLIAIEQAHRTS